MEQPPIHLSYILNPPVINSISFDNSGTMVTINGSNFQGIQKITFPVPGPDTALSYSVNKEFTQIVAAIPPGTATQDSIRVYCTYGVAAFAYPPPMTVTSVSNENGAPGTTITVNGTNFVGINEVTFPGGITSTNITPVSVNQFQVTVPEGISTADYLTVTGGLGTAKSTQPFATYITHPSPGYLVLLKLNMKQIIQALWAGQVVMPMLLQQQQHIMVQQVVLRLLIRQALCLANARSNFARECRSYSVK